MHRTRRPSLAAATARTLVLATTLVLWASAAAAQSLVLSNLVVDNQAGNLMARFGVAVDGVAELTESLQNGVTLGLTCKAKLSKNSGLFGSPQVAATEVTSRLKYDALTKEYALVLPGREAPLKNAGLQDLLRAGWGEMTLDMGPWRMLERGQEYTLALDIRLHQADIPNWFKRTLFFWSWDVAPSATYQLHFKY
jgi:hypothetical protein